MSLLDCVHPPLPPYTPPPAPPPEDERTDRQPLRLLAARSAHDCRRVAFGSTIQVQLAPQRRRTGVIIVWQSKCWPNDAYAHHRMNLVYAINQISLREEEEASRRMQKSRRETI